MSYEKSRSLLVAKMEMNHSSGPVDAMTEFKMAFAAGAISGMVGTGTVPISLRNELKQIYFIRLLLF
jgi:hypothetical protein